MSICIPDEVTWRSLFWGHVNKLGQWLQYERDEQKRGKPVADTWRDIITDAIICADDEVTDCMATKITDAVCLAIDECLEPRMASRHAEIMAALAAIETTTTTINNRTVTIGDYIISIGDTINNTTNVRNYNTLPPTPEERSGAQPIAETRPLQSSGITSEQFYGACISIVDGLVEAMVDYFERLEAISNALELTAIIAESIPIPLIGDVAETAAAGAKLADFVQEVAMEMFLAADTTPRRLNLADKLYCKGQHVRALDMNMIGEALAEAWYGDLIDWNDPIGSLARIATGEFAPEQVFYISLALGLAVWTVTGDFEGLITRATWRYWVNRGKNNPQGPVPDCGDEEETWIVYDFRDGWNSFSPRPLPDGQLQGVWVSGSGVRLVYYLGQGVANIGREWTQTYTVTQAVIELAWTETPTGQEAVYFHLNEPSYELNAAPVPTPVNGLSVLTWTGSVTVSPGQTLALGALDMPSVNTYIRRLSLRVG